MTETAEITKEPKISAIWIIPAIALLVGMWMLYQYQANKGPTIFIEMPQAEGIIAGKTEISSVVLDITEDFFLSIFL